MYSIRILAARAVKPLFSLFSERDSQTAFEDLVESLPRATGDLVDHSVAVALIGVGVQCQGLSKDARIQLVRRCSSAWVLSFVAKEVGFSMRMGLGSVVLGCRLSSFPVHLVGLSEQEFNREYGGYWTVKRIREGHMEKGLDVHLGVVLV